MTYFYNFFWVLIPSDTSNSKVGVLASGFKYTYSGCLNSDRGLTRQTWQPPAGL